MVRIKDGMEKKEKRPAIRYNPWEQDPNDPNRKYIELTLKKQNGDSTRYERIKSFRYLFKFLYENFGVKFILDYSINEHIELFDSVDDLNGNDRYKRKFRFAMQQLIYNIEYPYLLQRKSYNDVNWTLLYSGFKFTNSGYETQPIQITIEEFKEFFNKVSATNELHYVWFRMLLTAPRVGGATSFKVKDINFEEGFYITPEKGTKKKNRKGGKQANKYYIPDALLEDLKHYIEKYKLNENDRIIPRSDNRIREILHDDYGVEWTPHDFRHNMGRLWKRIGLHDVDKKVLLNHTLNSHEIYEQELSNTEMRRICNEAFNLLFK